MTHPNCATNGASLEDCHTNFFALADLCGIKWRRFYADSVLCYDPLDDPVLSSYSKCLATDILCVWRRVAAPHGHEQHRHGLQDANQLNYKKELWVFWYREEPDLTGLVSSELTADTEQGSWESGLSYECRTLLFKALHNLIERCLLSRSFSRLGRWFVQPYDGAEKSVKSPQLSFAFNFFIHGESTVCASVDVRQRISVSQLTRHHLQLAQACHNGLKVILCPYGMAGTLTGQSYKETDLTTQRLLSEWHHFYPLKSKSTKDIISDDDPMMSAVEVIVGGIKMRYPSSYVLVTELDEAAAVSQSSGNSHFPSYGNPSSTFCSSQPSKASLLAGVLTPPTSPCNPSHPLSNHGKFLHHPGDDTGSVSSSGCSVAAVKVKQSSWQASIVTSKPEASGEQASFWDFCDPSSLVTCNCSRCKATSQASTTSQKTATSNSSIVTTASSSTTTATTTTTSSSSSSTTPAPRKPDKPEKTKPQLHRCRTSTPFHRRNPYDACSEMDSFIVSIAPGATAPNPMGTNFQFKGPNQTLRSSTPSGLPQLHTSVVQPSSLGSPHPGTPLTDGPNSQTTEPAMPTLSPHPPSSKEEETTPIESQDQNQPQQSPSTIAEPSSNSSTKEKPSTELVSSPFQNNLSNMAENIKCEESSPAPQNNSNNANNANWNATSQEDVKPPVVQNPTSAVTAPPPVPARGLKRPALVVYSRDDPRDELVMDGLLYDYTFLNSSLWESIGGKRRRLLPRGGMQLYNEEKFVQCNKENLNQLPMEDILPMKQPKDPYEFNDEFDEESPSSSSFRVKVEEEEKPKEPGLPPTPESQSVTPGQVLSAPVTPTQDPPKPIVNGDQQALTPISPRSQQGGGTAFSSEKDLQVSDRDLDHIFDPSSSDDSVDDLFQTPSTPSSGKLCSTSEETFSGKCKSNSCTTGILGVAELTRMFPTPPSLEHNTAPSPSGPLCGTDMMVLDGTECREGVDGGSSPYYEPVKDWSFVYKLPVQYKFIGSKRYAPLTTLPSVVQPNNLSTEHVYKPSWTQAASTPQLPANSSVPNPQVIPHVERLPPNPSSQFQMMPVNEGERMVPPMFTVEPPLDQRTLPMNYELQSPASNASSYLNKHLNSVDSTGTASSIPEAHSLLVNLVIADSMLNLFKDHNFASCTLCVCNMNTKGSDAGINLPSSLIPAGIDEAQYKCTCGFSAVINRHQSHRSGIFYEDELDITGHRYETLVHRKSLSFVESTVPKKVDGVEDETNSQVDRVPHTVVDLIKMQCSQLYSSFSLFHKAERLHNVDRWTLHYNALEISDGCEVCFLALDTGRQAIDNMNNNKMDENLKSSCLHKWPYLAAKVPVSNLEVVHLLRSLQPVLQEAVQQRRHQPLWGITYLVLGPLTWRQFHRLAGRGTEDQCEPQPIPSLLVGYDKDWLALSPFALKYWDKLLLEPYTNNQDVAYVVVAPDSDFVLSHVKKYFKELSTIYELCRLGRHCPITKVLRDGIMRVGKSTAKKLADEPVDEWFTLIGDGPIANRLKLYAQACRYHLAPHLTSLSLDSSLLDSPPVLKPPEKPVSVASPRSVSANENQDKDASSKPSETAENKSDSSAPNSSTSNEPSATPSSSSESSDVEDSHQTPTVVIYLVEPFTQGAGDPDVYRLASLGLLRTYTHMMQFIAEPMRSAVQLQVVTLDSILSLGCTENSEKRKDQLKALAFSVYSQCHQTYVHQMIAKSLTGFGPAAAQDMFLKSRDARKSIFAPPLSKAFTLAPQKDKQTELGEMFGDRREKSGILYCTYCLTEDQRWLVASCTDDKGDILETCCISIEVPNRTRRKKASVRKFGLNKLLDFIVEVLSKCLHAWRLVISRLGRMGHGELRDWATLLSRKSLLRYSRQLRELCHQCAVLVPPDAPAILSACLVSLEPDSALRVIADQFTPISDDRFSSRGTTCHLSTPEDASCTHILVFPTSATTQSSQATFQQEHIDPLAGTLGEDDLFQALNDDDIAVGQDINDIFRWTESPPQSPGASPRRDSISQPGSPSCGMGGRHSPFHHGGPNRGSGASAMDTVEEPLQLLQQPLALGYYVSTAKTGPLPKWFWSTCPQLQNVCPVFLKSALLIHSPLVQQSSDDLLHATSHHPLDSNLTTDVLRYVLEGYNSLSWLSLDPSTHDRRSCLPVHVQILMQLYHAVEALI